MFLVGSITRINTCVQCPNHSISAPRSGCPNPRRCSTTNLEQNSESHKKSSEKQQGLNNLLRELGYLTKEGDDASLQICVPVFRGDDSCVVRDITETVMQAVFQPLMRVFDELQGNSQALTALKHGVAMKEVANELWHQIFGLINEYLVEVGFVERPPEISGEGRYLRSLHIGMIRSEPGLV